MKALKVFKKTFIIVFAFLYFTFALIMTVLLLNFNDYGVTQFGDMSLMVLKSKISNEDYKKGDLVIVEAVEVSEVNVGDTIFAYKVNSDNDTEIQVGKVGQVYEDQRSISFENGNTFSDDFIAGSPVKVYSGLGSFLSVIESKWGFLFIVLVPCFLIFIYEIYALIVEVKYGDEEE